MNYNQNTAVFSIAIRIARKKAIKKQIKKLRIHY